MKPSSCRNLALRLSHRRMPLPSLSSTHSQYHLALHHRQQRGLAVSALLVTRSAPNDGSRIGGSRTTQSACSFSTALQEIMEDEEEDVTMEDTHSNVWTHSHSKARNTNNISASTKDAKQHNNPIDATAAASPQDDARISECTCGFQKQQDVHNDNHEPLPPPLPKPVYSVHKRVLPLNLTALSSPQGRRYLLESMSHNTAESYWALTEQFVNQSDPAYCGVTTLLMVLNAMNIDPNVRWKGGWRYYGDEDVLLARCCLNTERIRRVGITMEQFMVLGTCHGMEITMKRPKATGASTSNSNNTAAIINQNTSAASQQQQQYTLEDFRDDIRNTLDSKLNTSNTILVTSFSRSALQQTGDGHYSPIAAYHEASDHVLVLDVARFKYAPYWASVEDLYQAMEPLDEATHLPRGWYLMRPPTSISQQHEMTTEDRRPAHLVPEVYEGESCPVGKIKVQFCPAKK